MVASNTGSYVWVVASGSPARGAMSIRYHAYHALGLNRTGATVLLYAGSRVEKTLTQPAREGISNG